MMLFNFNIVEHNVDSNSTNLTEFYNRSGSKENKLEGKIKIPEVSFHIHLLSIWVFTIFCEECRQVVIFISAVIIYSCSSLL
jgi:hypothetical protein